MERAPLSIQQAFGLALREQRERKGLSQERLAELAGLHRTYVGSVERGERNISIRNILTLAQALEISASHLIASTERLMPSAPPQD